MREWRSIVRVHCAVALTGMMALASCGGSAGTPPADDASAVAEATEADSVVERPDNSAGVGALDEGVVWVEGASFEWVYEQVEFGSDDCGPYLMIFVDTTEGAVVERVWEFPEESRALGFTERVQLFGPLDGTVTLTVTFENGEMSRVQREAFNERASDEQVSCPLVSDGVSPTEAPPTTKVLSPAVSAPEAGASIDGATTCPDADGSSERVTSFEQAPPLCIDPSLTYIAEIVTNLGVIVIDLDVDSAPNTVNNFVVLARYHYYEGAPFHRVIPGFVIQGGDAVGTPLGSGNPGYSFADELPEAGEYEVGSLAMANGGPDTNGSQFFVITGPDGVGLPPLYSLFGEVTSGLDVVLAIEAIPTAPGDVPSDLAVIESVTIIES